MTARMSKLTAESLQNIFFGSKTHFWMILSKTFFLLKMAIFELIPASLGLSRSTETLKNRRETAGNVQKWKLMVGRHSTESGDVVSAQTWCTFTKKWWLGGVWKWESDFSLIFCVFFTFCQKRPQKWKTPPRAWVPFWSDRLFFSGAAPKPSQRLVVGV